MSSEYLRYAGQFRKKRQACALSKILKRIRAQIGRHAVPLLWGISAWE